MPLSYYILVFLTLASAICAMSFRNLVHCALSLALSFIGVAALFLHVEAGFIAFGQILVYVGAVAILIVFAILLTKSSENLPANRSLLGFGVPVTILLAALLVYAVYSTQVPLTAQPASAPTVRELGQSLMTSYIVPLEILGVLLTVALLGAIVLALPDLDRKAD